jgi:hypothetical protein
LVRSHLACNIPRPVLSGMSHSLHVNRPFKLMEEKFHRSKYTTKINQRLRLSKKLDQEVARLL